MLNNGIYQCGIMRLSNKKLKSKALFRGFFGEDNTGDDVFSTVLSWGARRYWNIDRCEFLSRKLAQVPPYSRPVMLGRELIKGQKQLEVVTNVLRHRTIVIGGGSLLHNNVTMTSCESVIAMVSRVRNVDLIGVGLSLGPFRSEGARRRVREFLCRFKFLALRDRQSFEDALAMDLPFRPILAMDLAGMLPRIASIDRSVSDCHSGVPCLGVSVCHSERFVGGSLRDEEVREKKLLSTLRALCSRRDIRLKVFIINGHPLHGDEKVSRYFCDMLSQYGEVRLIDYSSNPLKTWNEIGKCTAFIGIRMHSGILACMAGVPFLQVEYRSKCGGFLDMAGVSDHWRIGDLQVSEKEVVDLLEGLIDFSRRGEKFVDVDTLVSKAELNFTGPAEYLL